MRTFKLPSNFYKLHSVIYDGTTLDPFHFADKGSPFYELQPKTLLIHGIEKRPRKRLIVFFEGVMIR